MMSERLGFNHAEPPENPEQDLRKSPLKRKRDESEAHLPISQGTGGREKIEWDKIIYRVSGIPSNIGKELLVSTVAHLFNIESAQFKIHSLAYDATYESKPRYKTATISFRTRPARLDLGLAESGGWSIDLEREIAEKYGCDHIYFDIHFQGFTPLSPAEKVDEQTIDCVVIHGWAGHALGSFKSPRLPYVWLRDSLPNHCPQLRIWTYGYRSELTDHKSIADVLEYAKTFKQQLRILRQKTKANEHSFPIIFMVHSLGGWIFKEAMTRMGDSSDQGDQLNILSTYGALFFGVPSQGMKVEALASMVPNLPTQYTLNLLNQELGYGLREKLHTEFCKAFHYRDSKIVQFYELEKSPTVIQDAVTKKWSREGPLELLVNPASATLGRYWETGDNYVMSLDGNHSDMVKFSEFDRSGFEKICNVLKDFVKVAPSIIKARKDSLGEPQIPAKPAEFTQDQKACLQSLYFPEMHWRRDDINEPAKTTCQWILKHESYKKWYKDQRGLLWIKGNPGAGKSTVLKHAFKAAKQNNEVLILASFFFHGRGSSIQKSALGLFRSLLHQILQQVPDLLIKFASLYRQRCNTEGENGTKWDWRERDLQEFFSLHVTETAKTLPMRLYIDALDECGQDPAISLVEYFCRFADPIAICFACRHYPIISLEEAGVEISVEHKNAPDIDTYITNRIQSAVGNERFANSMRHELKERSACNFQWVVLVTPRVIQFYKNGKPLTAICELIRTLPSELANLYEEIVRGTEPDDMAQALHLFQWTCFAFKPLTLQELREATALDIHTSHASLQESRIDGQYAETDEEMERRVLSLSQGLLEVEKHDSERTVQLVHQSVMDFLLQDGFRLFYEQLPGNHLNGSVVARGHFWISRACIKYISMDEVTSFWCTNPATYDIEEEETLTELLQMFALFAYAADYLITHTQIVEQENVLQDDLVVLLQPPPFIVPRTLHKWQSRIEYVVKCDASYICISSGMTLIHIASAYGLSSVVSCILERDTRNTEINAGDDEGRTALHFAAEGDHEAIVKRLLGNGAKVCAKERSFGKTPIHYAAQKGYEGVVYLLLEAGATPDSTDNYGETPLSLAAENCHKDVVELLLEWGAKADTVDEDGETPLSQAAYSGHQMTMELLLENGARANTINERGQTPISYAVERGHESAVRLLLKWGAKADAIDKHGEPPLSLAARYGHQLIMGLLLERGARANTMNEQGSTPLSYAARKGDESAVRLLLKWGAKADTMDKDGETPLSLATRYSVGQMIMELLLENGGRANTTDKTGQTPISYATLTGQESVVRLLLEHRADPDSEK